MDGSPGRRWSFRAAVAEVSGPAPALGLVEELDLGTYYLWHAVRVELLRRLDRRPEASAAYEAAIELADNAGSTPCRRAPAS